MSKKKSNHGGARPGAGRPQGSGKYKEPTKAIRVPEGSIRYIKDFLEHYPNVTRIASAKQDYMGAQQDSTKQDSKAAKDKSNVVRLSIPLYSSKVAAGYPSPAEDHIEDTLDLNDYMVQHPDSTFMLRVEGESMKNAGIMPNVMQKIDYLEAQSQLAKTMRRVCEKDTPVTIDGAGKDQVVMMPLSRFLKMSSVDKGKQVIEVILAYEAMPENY